MLTLKKALKRPRRQDDAWFRLEFPQKNQDLVALPGQRTVKKLTKI